MKKHAYVVNPLHINPLFAALVEQHGVSRFRMPQPQPEAFAVETGHMKVLNREETALPTA